MLSHRPTQPKEKEMARSPGKRELERKLERAIAQLRAALADMQRENNGYDEVIQKIENILKEYINAFEVIVSSNMTLRILLQTKAERLARKGYRKRDVGRIRRMLERNAALTADWLEPDSLLAEAIGTIIAAGMLYRDIAKQPPPRKPSSQ